MLLCGIRLIMLFAVFSVFLSGPSPLQLEVAIDTVAGVDQAGYRPLHWLLFGKALVVGTGHVSSISLIVPHRRSFFP